MGLLDLETPVLIADLDIVERNVERMQAYCDEHGLSFRPHIKTHKVPALAHLQLRRGAVGITCQKLGEAEVMAAVGIDDVLISFPLVGRVKAERLVALARHARVGVVGDSAAVARGLSEVLAAEGVEVGFLVECDTGFARTGVTTPQNAAELAEVVAALPGLRFDGLMTYPTVDASGPWLTEARRTCEARGMHVRVVSGGGTATAFRTHHIGGITEVRAGTYVYGDLACVAQRTHTLEGCALRVRATIVSHPTRERAIIDAGSKTLTSDPAEGTDSRSFGLIVEYPEARIYALSEEHGHIDVSSCVNGGPEIGEAVTIIPNHACGTTNLHDDVVVHRGGALVGVWPIAARGRIR